MRAELIVRAATVHDAVDVLRLRRESFPGTSGPAEPGDWDPPPDPSAAYRPTYLAFRGDRLVAQACDRPFTAWFGGRGVSMSGLASVTVQAEERGRGLLTPLLVHLLRAARDRGARIAGLFPTAPAVYRGLGFETVGAYTVAEAPTSALAQVRPGGDDRVTLERLERPGWWEAAAVYEAWAPLHDGALERQGPCFADPAAPLNGAVGTLARDRHGVPVGYAVWRRTGGYLGDGGRLEIDDLVALTPAAGRALLANLGAHRAVAPLTRITGAGEDLLPQLLPSNDWRFAERIPYQLLLLDVAGALEARGYPKGLRARLTFEVTGHPLERTDGTYRLDVSDGTARVRRGALRGRSLPRLTAAGLARLYAGVPPRSVRLTGQLTGPMTEDETLALVFGGRAFAIRDYF
ncbi:MAG: GNAT family N-acetyltransferase [Dermatophilaceae bacterium]